MSDLSQVRSRALVVAAISLLGAGLILGGCVSGATSAMKAGSTGAIAGGKMEMASKTTTTGPDVQKCADCAGKGMAPMVKGKAASENGVQIVRIGLKDGYYSPNEFMVKAGQPVKVIFTGKATECLAHPMFPTMDKKGDLTKTGSATFELGSLNAGTYPFACGMKMTGGKIVAQ